MDDLINKVSIKRRFVALVPALVVAYSAHPALAVSTTVEADIGEFFIVLDQTSTEEGDVAINVDNQGSIGHVIAIDGTGLSTSYLSPGSTGSLSGALAPGTYDVICTISGHASAGMSTVLVVNASATTTPTTVLDSSTTTEPESEVTTGETQSVVGEVTPVLANSGSNDMSRLGGGILMVAVGICIVIARRTRTYA